MNPPRLLAAGVLGVAAAIWPGYPAAARILLPQDLDQTTVVLPGGWELPGMAVRWSDPDAGLWVVRDDGARRLYRPEELVGLRDAQGRDITAEVLPAWALERLAIAPRMPLPRDRDAEPAWDDRASRPDHGAPRAQVDEREAGSSTARDWRFLFGFEAGLSKPHDLDLADSEGGLGFDVRARLQFAGSLYLAGGYSWQDLERAASDVIPQPAEPEDGPASLSWQTEPDVRIEGVWAGLSLVARGEDDQAARFYLEGGIGRYTVEGLYVMEPAEAYLGYHAGLGFLVPLGPAGALDLGFRGTHIVNLDLGYGDDSHTLIGVRLGLDLLAR